MKSKQLPRPRQKFIMKRKRSKLEDNPDTLYVVEKILDKSYTIEGELIYLTKWKDYPPSDNTWEPAGELEKYSKDLVDAFEGRDRHTPELLYCICQKRYWFEDGGMIQCGYCLNWFHFVCLNMSLEEANDYERYFCERCESVNPFARCLRKSDPQSQRANMFKEEINDTDSD